MRPQEISINDYTYELPADRIAQHPLPERDASKLLIYKNGNISQDIYRNIAEYIPADSALIINNTRVVRARIYFEKPTGGIIEIFCLGPDPQYADMATAMGQRKKVLWNCLIGGASKWKAGQVLEKLVARGGQHFTLYARYIQKLDDAFLIEFSWEPGDSTFAEILDISGVTPLPPYIKRKPEEKDADRYQTIYGNDFGSVAAPTAGLHFTTHIFDQLSAKNILRSDVTLHVSAGTFKPVKSETMAGHDMHEEFFEVNQEDILDLADFHKLQKPIIATGTTTLRAVESIYWLGVKLILQPGLPEDQWVVNQWDPYELEKENIPVEAALNAVVEAAYGTVAYRIIARTQLLIAPGYSFKIPTGLITNFHQPQSTLLLLVAAFVGEDWRKIYRYALENDFRFLSYGDGSLLFRKQ
jgi:S-adenosylmethionine:tRNA ribosyltransferase-isomerase